MNVGRKAVATNQRVSVEMLRRGEESPAPLLLSLAAAGLVLVSAFGVIYSSHACRELYAQLQDLEAGQWHLQEDYSRLLLEESTWASHHRVEKVATDDLAMQPPAVENLQVVVQ